MQTSEPLLMELLRRLNNRLIPVNTIIERKTLIFWGLEGLSIYPGSIPTFLEPIDSKGFERSNTEVNTKVNTTY